MKKFKKINFGLVLTIITLCIVVIYNVRLESYRSEQKESIKKVCESYIDLYNKYSMLDEKYRTIPKTITDEEYTKYLDTMKEDVKKVTINNEKVVSSQYEYLKSNLEYASKSNIVITESNRNISQIKSYAFVDDTVTVEFTISGDVRYITDSNKEEQIQKIDSNMFPNAKIILKNEDGEWKITYAYIFNSLQTLGFSTDTYVGG